jgi:steroid delta-isomerase-like uncharacterized protein
MLASAASDIESEKEHRSISVIVGWMREATEFMRNRLGFGFLFVVLVILGVSQPTSPTAAQQATPEANCAATTPEENLAIVRRFYEEGAQGGDVSVFDEVAAPDIIYYGATVGPKTSVEDLKKTYQEAIDAFDPLTYTLLSSTVGPDAVAVRYEVQGKHTGEFRKIAPSGNTITWTHSAIAHVECGKIVEMWAQINQLDRLNQLGVLTTVGPAALMVGAPVSAATPIAASAAENCAPESPEDILAVVTKMRTEVYNDGNLDAMPEVFADGYIHGSANGPDAIGIDEGARRIGTFITAIPDLEWTFDEVIVDGDHVAARWTTQGTQTGDLAGFPATGKPVNFSGISNFTVRCGKIVEYQTEMDVVGLLEQIGAPLRSDEG